MPSQPALVALIAHGSSPSWAPVPVLAHLPGDVDAEQESDSADMKICSYGNAESSYFVVPSAGPKAYSPTDAAIVHTRSLVFLRERLGGPYFDLEQIWEEHTHYEFVDRSVSKTMGTMVVSLALRPCLSSCGLERSRHAACRPWFSTCHHCSKGNPNACAGTSGRRSQPETAQLIVALGTLTPG